MRKATALLVAFALAALSVGVLAGPAGAAPNNKNNQFSFELDCDDGLFTVQVAPGDNSITAWDVESGQNYVAKSINQVGTVTLTSPSGYGEVVNNFFKDYGAKAPAKGRTLLTCTSHEGGSIPSPLTADDAGFLNYLFETDTFAAGQGVVGTYSNHWDLQLLVPGK